MSSSEGLYRTTVCRCLVHRPPYSARLMRFGSRGPSEFFFSQIRHRSTLIEIARKDAVQGIYRIVREKQGIVVYRQCSLQTVTSLRVVSLVFRGHDLLKITNINPQGQQQQHHARFSRWKKLDSSRESGENGT